jgi:oxygen-independent coproporphyrinogen III oxidase
MSGIYIHIPFCKQACNYCDFHFSTTLQKKEAIIEALAKEIQLRKNEFKNKEIETIYFGGGTPSLLNVETIEYLISIVYKNYMVIKNPEITLEANPDDLDEEKIIALSKTKINRLSIGIQSFFEADLKLMNRAHNAAEAKKCLETATKYFDNISIDLIYGIPSLTDEKWLENINTALSYQTKHISSYALTVEPKTALYFQIKNKTILAPDEEQARKQFDILVEKLQENGFVHYEISNFGKENYFSKNNSSYWQGKKYLGIGPSAHSFDGQKRSWNVANNNLYLKSILENKLPSEYEILSKTDLYNEYIMTGLRTIWGISLDKIAVDFGAIYLTYLMKQAQKYFENESLYQKNNNVFTHQKAKFLTDGIAADLFFVLD